MPNDDVARSSLEEFRLDLRAARDRLERHVAYLAQDKGVVVTVEFESDRPSFEGGPDVYMIRLHCVRIETAVRVDHEVLTGSDEFFGTFVLPQLSTAIHMLASCQGDTKQALG